MAQERTFDFRSPRSSYALNRHIVGLMPAGVYSGFTVSADGNISSGILLSNSGVKITESGTTRPQYGDQWQYTGVPANGSLQDRLDVVVCDYTYLPSVPPTTARYMVIQGTPGSGEYPTFYENFIPIAWCKAAAQSNGIWAEVIQAGPPEKLFNCHRAGVNHVIEKGALGALRVAYCPSADTASSPLSSGLNIWIIPPGTLANGDTITWGAPSLTIDGTKTPYGIKQLDDWINMLSSITPAGVLSNGPGAARIGASAITGANGKFSTTGTNLQAVIAAIVANADAIMKTAEDLATTFGHDHTATGTHKAINQAHTSGTDDGYKLLSAVSSASGTSKLRTYSYNRSDYANLNSALGGVASFVLTINAEFDVSSGKWKADDTTKKALIFRVHVTSGQILLSAKNATGTPWDESGWSSGSSLGADEVGSNIFYGNIFYLGVGPANPCITCGVDEKGIGSTDGNYQVGSKYYCSNSGNEYTYTTSGWKKVQYTT